MGLLLAAAGLAGLLAAAWLIAGRLHRFAYWIGARTEAELDALATDGWRRERLEVAPGIVLQGLSRPPQREDAPWLLFAPGNSEGLLPGFRSELDRVRGDADIGLLLFAWRGFDGSGGTPGPEALAADLLRQWDLLRGRGVAAQRIEIWGYSLGTPLALQLAAALADRGEAPRRVVLAAAAPLVAVMPFGPFGRFRADDHYDAGPALARVRGPVVIAHGTADDVLPLAGARELARALGDRATLHELPGRTHFDLWPELQRLRP